MCLVLCGDLSIGTLTSGGSYGFTNYNIDNTDGITDNDGDGIAFDSDGDVGYAADGGGLSIGLKADNSYTFTNYDDGTDGITNNSGSSVAFDSDGNVGYTSLGGGLSIGKFTPFAISLDTTNIVYDRRDDIYNINQLHFTFDYSPQQSPTTKHTQPVSYTHLTLPTIYSV